MNVAHLFSRGRSRRGSSRRFRARSERSLPVSRLQRLEDRVLLAGNVMAQFVGRDAVLHGDMSDNSVEIIVDSGNVIVRGLDGTTINGGDTDFVLATGTDRLRDDMRIFLGAGNDRLVIGNGVIVSDNLTIWAGVGDDSVALSDSTVGGNVTIFGLPGNDTISVQNSSIGGDLVIHGGAGSNLINVSDSMIGDDARIHGSSSADDIVITGTTIRDNTRVFAYGGSDNVVIQNSTLGRDLSAFAGAGNDVLMISNSTVGDDARVFAGAGNDSVVSQASTVRDKLRAFGGAGNDGISRDAASTARRARVRNFELSTVADAIIAARITDPVTGALARAAAAVAAFDPGLTLTVDNSTVAEDGGTGVATVTIERNTDTTADLVVNLTSSNAARLDPASATVTIPAGQTSVTVDLNAIDDSLINGDATVTITGTATGVNSGTVDVTVTDDEAPALTVDIPVASVSEDNGTAGNAGTASTVTVTVSRDSNTADALTVNLTSSATGRLTVPATVIIPAGQSSATFTATTVPNTTADGNASVTITASGTGFVSGSDTITVNDNDSSLSLSVSVADATVSEADGAGATSVTITRNVASASPLTVSLGSSSTSRLTVPATATIPANQTSVTVDVATVNNNVVDGDALIVITATASGATPAQANISVTDDDVASIVLAPSSNSVDETDGSLTMTITRTGATTAEETVSLTYSAGAKISGPSTATFGTGVSEVTVMLTITDDQNFDDDTVATITATTPGHPTVSTNITVVNDEILSLTFDNSANTTVQSVGTLITKDQTFVVAGTTAPGATVAIDSNADGNFDDGTTIAAPDGTFTMNVVLSNNTTNHGANSLNVRSRLSSGDEVFNALKVHYAIGTVVRFDTNQDLNQDSVMDFYDVELLDTDAPITVANFLNYVDSGRYQDMFVHRSPADFVIQGGGFTVSGGAISNVPTFPTIQNEFLEANSNLRGTLSMALPAGNINAGTSQWFVNVVDNTFLDRNSATDTSVHTVFGRVIGDGMNTVDAINTLVPYNLTGATGVSALGETPVSVPPIETLTGTATVAAGGAAVTGIGTLFTSELAAGDVITIGTDQFVVGSIQSDTQLTLQLSSAQLGHVAYTNAAIGVIVQPPDADFVIFSNIGELLNTV
ncbi:MAG: peptidylprolyl isomerase [Planctomycetaceae bacterium]